MTNGDQLARAASLLVLACVGCGRLGFDAISPDGSASEPRDAASHAADGETPDATPAGDGSTTSPGDAGTSIPADDAGTSIPADASAGADAGSGTDAGIPPIGAGTESCRTILAGAPGAADGTYTISISGVGATMVTCDMTTDGGGWTLILSYVHQAMTTPSPVARASSFPLLGTATLGEDGSTDASSWGHARPSLLAALPFGELRFQCRSSSHARALHFVTSSASCASYMRTGTGYCSDLRSTTRLLPDHTAMLPLAATHVTGEAGDSALTTNPFYDPGSLEWLMNGAEWECDGSVAARADTIHRVWVR